MCVDSGGFRLPHLTNQLVNTAAVQILQLDLTLVTPVIGVRSTSGVRFRSGRGRVQAGGRQNRRMTIVVAGGSGFLGSALTSGWRVDGHRVLILTRHPKR